MSFSVLYQVYFEADEGRSLATGLKRPTSSRRFRAHWPSDLGRFAPEAGVRPPGVNLKLWLTGCLGAFC